MLGNILKYMRHKKDQTAHGFPHSPKARVYNILRFTEFPEAITMKKTMVA